MDKQPKHSVMIKGILMSRLTESYLITTAKNETSKPNTYFGSHVTRKQRKLLQKKPMRVEKPTKETF